MTSRTSHPSANYAVGENKRKAPEGGGSSDEQGSERTTSPKPGDSPSVQEQPRPPGHSTDPVPQEETAGKQPGGAFVSEKGLFTRFT